MSANETLRQLRNHMDLKRIEYFLSVAEHGSFSRAASILGVAQPALGRQVRKLEELCGTKLFYRHGRGVSLTQEGRLFAERIKPVLEQLRGAINDMRETAKNLSGMVIIGMTPTMEALIGFRLLQNLRQTAPGINIHFRTGYSAHVHEWLLDGRLDIAIVHNVRRSQHITVQALAQVELFLISHPDKAKEAGTLGMPTIPFKKLAGLDLALPGKPHGLRRTIDVAAEKLNIDLNVQFELDTLSLLKEAALAGVCHTVLAMPGVTTEIKNGTLVASAIVNPIIETRLMLATSLNRPLTLAGKAVQGSIRSLIAQAIQDAAVPLNIHLL